MIASSTPASPCASGREAPSRHPGEPSLRFGRYDALPSELKEWPQWVLWREEERLNENTGEVRRTKVPHDPRRRTRASSTDPDTWATFAEVASNPGDYHGIGFVFTPAARVLGIDLDGCRDPETEMIAPWAQSIIATFDSYTEVSPSGTGVHIYVKGALPAGGWNKKSVPGEAGPSGKRPAIEVYDRARFFTVTGEHLLGTPQRIESRQAELDELQARYAPPSPPTSRRQAEPQDATPTSLSDAELLDRARNATNGPLFGRLWAGNWQQDYGSPSEADMALCGMLAFWTGRDAAQMDRLFRQSGLMRDEKWDSRRGESTYGAITIAAAIAGCTDVYTPSQIPPARATRASIGERPPLPAIISAPDLMKKSLPPPKWAVPGIVPEGLTMLAGRPKQGKSWGVYGLALAIASGGKAFGRIDVEQGEVLYLALEDSHRRLQERLKILLNGHSVPADLHLTTDWPRLLEEGRPAAEGATDCLSCLSDWLASHPRSRLVVIDTLALVRPARGRAGNVYEEDYQVMSQLKRLADRFNIALIVITHTRKPSGKGGSGDVFDEVTGSTAITGGADATLILKRARNEQEVLLHVTGRDVEEQELAIHWDKDTGDWRLLGPAVERRQTEARQQILQVLREAGEPLHYREVTRRLGKAGDKEANTVKTWLWRMSKEDLVFTWGDGKYRACSEPGETGEG